MRLFHYQIFVMMLTAATLLSSSHAQEGETDAAEQPTTLRQSMLGAWVITGAPGNTNKPQPDAEMKFWGLGDFAVTKRNAATGKIDYHHVGTYTLKGDEYTETVTFAIGATENLVGNSFKFRIQVDGDTYIQRGIGNPYTQQWQRLKPVEKAGVAEE